MASSMIEQGNNTITDCWRSEGFGPVVGRGPCPADRDGFDFTLGFEQSVMSIGPSALLLLAFPLRWLQLQSQSRKTQPGEILGLSKVGCIVVFGLLQLTLLILWATTSNRPKGAFGQVTIASCALGLVDAFALLLLSFAEHRKSIRPSTLISIYLLVSLALDVVQCRTLWLLPQDTRLHTIASIFTASIALKFSILVLETKQKRKFLIAPWNRSPPEALSGTISHSFFWWLNGLFQRGYKDILNLESLWSIDNSIDSERLMHNLIASWNKKKDNRKKKHSLAKSMISSLKWPIAAAWAPRMCLIGLRFSQPLLLNQIVKYSSQLGDERQRNVGYGLIGATALIYFGTGLLKGIFNYKNTQFIAMARGSLVSIIMSKILTVSATVAADKGSDALTLMSTDVEKIVIGLTLFNDTWAAPIEVAIALVLLQRQLGVAFIVPGLMALIASSLVLFVIAPRTGRAAAIWNKGVQARVTLTAAVLGNMKEVKLLGLTNRWLEDIQSRRVSELKLSTKFRIQSVYRLTLMFMSNYLTAPATLGIFLIIARKNNESLSVATTFTTLSILSLISNPLSYLFAAFPQVAISLACAARIQAFLLEDDKLAITNYTHARNDSRHSLAGSSNSDVELQAISQQRPSSESGPQEVLTLKRASFGTKEGGAYITRNIDLDISRSTFTIVIGKVGSGKSTLLKGLIGELNPLTGTIVNSLPSFAYCEQDPWLTNDTIQNNILGQSALEARWYETVINACGLDKDFAALPSGGLSVIGSKGISLSGGQKARVALARAVYARQRLAIIDDMLSGLDWATEEFVWDNVFGPSGLLRQSMTTIILATHKVRHLREADNIVVLGENGSVIESGTFDLLEAQNGYVQSLFVEEQAKKSGSSSHLSELAETSKGLAAAQAKDVEPEDDRSRKTGDFTLYKYYFKSIGFKNAFGIMIMTAIGVFFQYFPQYWVKLWAEADTKKPGDRTGMFYGLYLTYGVVGLSFIFVSLYFAFCVVTQTSGEYLHQKLLDTIMGAPLSFFVSTDTGITVNRFSQDMQLVDMELTIYVYVTNLGLLTCIAGSILVIAGIKYMAVAIPFTILFMYLLQKYYLSTSRQLRYMDIEAKSPLYTHILETIQGLSTIRSFGWGPANLASSLNFLDVSQRPFYLLYCVQHWLELVLDLFVGGLAVLFVGIAVSVSEVSSPGAIGLALLNLLSMSESLAHVIQSWTQLETSLGAIARLRDVERDTPKEAREGETLVPELSWPAQGKIAFSDVCASYGTDEEEYVLRNVSFTVEAGQKVAICGRTGSGKSSLLLTLFRLLDLRSGDIAIDNLSTASMPRETLRSHLNIIPQDPIIFPGSVRLNAIPSQLELAPSADEYIIAALTTVSLWSLISSRGGLDADMSSIPLSQGQKQLFCLARAIMRREKSPILVLDEPTSNVDHHTDELMQTIIREEWKGKTIIAVVHKLNTVLDFDRIAVLDRGELVEFDEPLVLREREGSVFKSLWESQR